MRRLTKLGTISETCRRLSDERIPKPSVPFDALGGQSAALLFARSRMNLSTLGRFILRRAPVRTKQDEPAQSALIKRRRDHKVLRFYTILSAMIKRVPSKQADEYWSLTPDTMNQICPAASEVQANRSIPTIYEKNVKKGVNTIYGGIKRRPI